MGSALAVRVEVTGNAKHAVRKLRVARVGGRAAAA